MNSVNIGDCINSSVYSAIGSSGSGAGGGFSGGGGGGRRPVVEEEEDKYFFFLSLKFIKNFYFNYFQSKLYIIWLHPTLNYEL